LLFEGEIHKPLESTLLSMRREIIEKQRDLNRKLDSESFGNSSNSNYGPDYIPSMKKSIAQHKRKDSDRYSSTFKYYMNNYKYEPGSVYNSAMYNTNGKYHVFNKDSIYDNTNHTFNSYNSGVNLIQRHLHKKSNPWDSFFNKQKKKKLYEETIKKEEGC
jgi:hypothetical protein